jgi:hypothetical protein
MGRDKYKVSNIVVASIHIKHTLIFLGMRSKCNSVLKGWSSVEYCKYLDMKSITNYMSLNFLTVFISG